jgi:hypothetical protein
VYNLVSEWVHPAAHCLQEEPHQGGGTAAEVRRFNRRHHRGTISATLPVFTSDLDRPLREMGCCFYEYSNKNLMLLLGRIAQVVERRPLDREVRGSNPSHDTMALFLGRHYEFPQCGIIKEKLLLLLLLLYYYYYYY